MGRIRVGGWGFGLEVSGVCYKSVLLESQSKILDVGGQIKF